MPNEAGTGEGERQAAEVFVFFKIFIPKRFFFFELWYINWR